MRRFDISPFALPNCEAGEYIFEEPHDICRVEVTFKGPAPRDTALSYLRHTWPEQRFEDMRVMENPFCFGWFPIDDYDNSTWQAAAVDLATVNDRTIALTFKGLSREMPDFNGCDVDFRRTLGIKVDTRDPDAIEEVRIYTKSTSVQSDLRIELDAGARRMAAASRCPHTTPRSSRSSPSPE